MNHSELLTEVLDHRAKRQEGRREFMKVAAGSSAAVAGAAFLASCGGGDGGGSVSTPAPSPSASGTAFTDFDILNFALNLEYLEAEFYAYATTGAGLAANLRTGIGQQGAVTPGKAVNFTDPVVRQYAREIAADEIAHVAFLRRVLGTTNAVAEPAIDVGFGVNNAFSVAARSAGLVGAGQAFDPYATDEAFLLGAFIFEDVGVTAYKGAAPLLSRTYIEAAAGILAAEAYHAGLVRTVLYRKGLATPAPALDLIGATVAISDARDRLDGATDLDQGIRATTTTTGGVTTTTSNIVPVDANAIAFSRSAAQVLNIVYLSPTAVSAGGFFPSGVNGNIRVAQAG
ncbi:MAG: ferritin-like domain-containing protein [Pseudomonadota bacterium]